MIITSFLFSKALVAEKGGSKMGTYPHVKETITLIRELVSIPSPSGNTGRVIDFCEQYLDGFKIEMKRNRKGGLLITIPGKDTNQHRMLTAHVDTLGAMVKEIKSNGRLKLAMIGGFRWNSGRR